MRNLSIVLEWEVEQLERLCSEDNPLHPHTTYSAPGASPPAPHDQLYYWSTLDPRLKQDKVKATDL